MRRTSTKGILACLVAVGLGARLPAAEMNYGDFLGDTLTYEQVTEINGEPNLLFSAPSVVGDVLEFDPVNFLAEVDPGPGVSIVDSQLMTTITSKPGSWISNLMIMESGDFTLVGLPDDAAGVTVGAAFFVQVTEINGVPVGDGPILQEPMVFTSGTGPHGGEYAIPGDAGISKIWKGTVMLDVQAALEPGDVATQVKLSFDNTLSASAGSGTAAAFIKKKDFGGIVVIPNIPEPTSATLGFLAVVASLAACRRPRA